MHLSDWEGLAIDDKRRMVAAAISICSGELNVDSDDLIKLMRNIWVVDEFVQEILRARRAGKQRYSAQSIYEYLSHKYLVHGGLNFTKLVKSADFISKITLTIFSAELGSFFDDAGVIKRGNG